MTADKSGVTSSGSSANGKPLLFVRGTAVAAATVLFAFGLIRFLHPVGLTSYEYWWLMIVALAVGVFALSARTNWQTAGLVAATFAAGFGAQLALKQPLWFQFVRITPTSDFSHLMLASLGLQALTAALVLLQKNIFKHGIRVLSDFGWGRVFLVLLVLGASSIGAMDYIGRHLYGTLFKQLSVGSAFIGLNILSFVALAVTAPADQLNRLSDRVAKTISLPGSSEQIRKFDKQFPFWLAGAVFVVCVFIALVVFDAIPHLDDVIYLFQAKYFAQGHVSLPLPPSTEAFGNYLIDSHDGKWFAVTMPGWPLVLAIGSLIHMPWIINPLLAAVSVVLLHSFVTSMIDRGTGNLVALLMSVSPWYLSMSSTMLLHTLTYAAILGAWVLLISARQRPSLASPFVAGALMGFLFLTRPLEGVLIGVLTGLWTLSFLRDRSQWKTVALYGAGCIAIGALIFLYHIDLTGDPLSTPINAYVSKIWGPGANAMGFGPNIGPPNWGRVDLYKGHSPFEAMVHFQQNLYTLNFELFGWGVGSLTFALIFAFWGKWTKLAGAMATIVVATIGAYSLYWFVGCFFTGPRYWFLVLVPMLIFTALGLKVCADRLDRFFPNRLAPQRIGLGVVFLCLCSVLIFENWLCFNKYPGYNGYHGEYRELSKQERFKNSLIFIATDSDSEYGSALWLNDFSTGSDRPLFARDLGMETDRQVAAAYPDRKIFFVKGHSGARDHIKITRGPLSVDDLK